jgi:hypothetical protein
MNDQTVISCPRCVRQYRVDSATDRIVAQCGVCKAHFKIVIPVLTGQAEDALVLEGEIEPHYVYFREACETMARNTCELIKLAGGNITAEHVLSIVQNLPRSGEDVVGDTWQSGVLSRVLKLAFERGLPEPEEQKRKQLFEYFLGYIPSRSYCSLDMLQAAFAGVLGGIDWSEAVREHIVVLPAKPQKPARKRFAWWAPKHRQPENFWTAMTP